MNPFSGKAHSGGGGSEIPPAGAHVARVVALIDLGSHSESYAGQAPRMTRKVMICYELVNEKKSGSTENHIVGERYTLSFHKKSKLRTQLESVRGQPYPEDAEIDLTKFLGVPCLVSIQHGTSTSGRTYASIDNLTAVPKGMPVPQPTKPTLIWFIGSDDPIPDSPWIPYVYGEPVTDVVKRSKEWIEAHGGTANGNGRSQRPTEPADMAHDPDTWTPF